MIVELTENEQITLLGILEDISQAADVNHVLPIQSRIALKSIILKLGGTYFGQLETNKYSRAKDMLSSIYGIMEE